jgi:uncharacterized protein (TIGR02996 family)
MNEHDALLQAIREHPEDDHLRLIYADWLEERGDPRAAFIRVQCALASLAEEDQRRAELEARERQLVLRHRQEWKPLPECESLRVDYQRGFVHAITVAARDFLEHGERLFQLAPVREAHVWEKDVARWVPLLARCPQLSRLRQFQLHDQGHGSLDEEGIKLLADSPYLEALEGLGLSYNNLGVGGVRGLTASALLGRLRRLDLASNNFGVSGVEVLVGSGRLDRLEVLDLSGVLGDAGVQALADYRGIYNLTSLSLQGARLRAPGLRSLAASARFPRLTTLDVRANEVGDEGLQALAQSRHLSRLQALDVSDNQVGSTGPRALAQGRGLPELTSLRLAGNLIGPRGVKDLAGSATLAGLRRLDLDDNPEIGDAGAEALAASPHLGQLTSLSLCRAGLSPWGVKALAGSPHLVSLTTLRVAGNKMGDDCLRALGAFPLLGRLRTLDVSNNPIGDEGVKSLARSRYLAGLRELDLSMTEVTDEGLRALAAAPLARLVRLTLDGSRLDPGTRDLLEARFGAGVCDIQD